MTQRYGNGPFRAGSARRSVTGMTHTWHAEPDGCGSFIVRDEFGHPAIRANGTMAQFASQAMASAFATAYNSRENQNA